MSLESLARYILDRALKKDREMESLSDEDVQEILEDYDGGMGLREITRSRCLKSGLAGKVVEMHRGRRALHRSVRSIQHE